LKKILFIAVTILFSSAAFYAQTTITTQTTTPTPTPRSPQTRPSPAPTVRPLTQEERQRQQQSSQRRQQEADSGDPDVLLDVPNLSVDEITLEVENLRAKVSLDARLANLLQLSAGADVGIDKVKLTIKGVKAEVLLKVKLDNVAAIIDRTLTTIDRNPEILERLLQSVDNTVGTVGNVANTALAPGGVLSQTVNTLGQTVQRTLDTTGNIVEKTLDTTGKVVNQRTVGSVLNTAATGLRVVGETTNNAGQTVRRLQDASGGIVEVTLDSAGKIVNSRIVSGATTRPNQ
jgi:hypothetical protein